MLETATRDVTGKIRILLQNSPIAEIRKIRVEQHGDELQLKGRVRSYYAKQMAQETARKVAGELHIVNSVMVD